MHHHDGSTECANRCGNLNQEHSKYCGVCEDEEK